MNRWSKCEYGKHKENEKPQPDGFVQVLTPKPDVNEDKQHREAYMPGFLYRVIQSTPIKRGELGKSPMTTRYEQAQYIQRKRGWIVCSQRRIAHHQDEQRNHQRSSG